MFAIIMAKGIQWSPGNTCDEEELQVMMAVTSYLPRIKRQQVFFPSLHLVFDERRITDEKLKFVYEQGRTVSFTLSLFLVGWRSGVCYSKSKGKKRESYIKLLSMYKSSKKK